MPRTMNDPHVDALVFRIEHGPALAYSDDAPPIDREEPGFRVTLKDGTVRFELKEHYATKKKRWRGFARTFVAGRWTRALIDGQETFAWSFRKQWSSTGAHRHPLRGPSTSPHPPPPGASPPRSQR